MGKRLLALLAVALLLAGCGGREARADAPPAGVPLKVMTYNIRIGVGPDKFPGKADPTENLRAIGAFIVESGADVVLLQEVDRASTRTSMVDEVAVLEEATGFHSAWTPAIEKEGFVYGIAILSRWPISRSEPVKLPKVDYATSHPDVPEWYSEQRMALVARIDGPRPFSAIGTHLGLTKEQRVDQIMVLASLAEEEMKAGRPVVVGGDLNAEPDAPELMPLRALLRDVYQGHVDKHSLEYDMAVRERLTFPALGPDRCIDYIFVSARDFDVKSAEVPARTFSDHLPMVASLELLATK